MHGQILVNIPSDVHVGASVCVHVPIQENNHVQFKSVINFMTLKFRFIIQYRKLYSLYI